jgi:hypothetical protein
MDDRMKYFPTFASMLFKLQWEDKKDSYDPNDFVLGIISILSFFVA